MEAQMLLAIARLFELRIEAQIKGDKETREDLKRLCNVVLSNSPYREAVEKTTTPT